MLYIDNAISGTNNDDDDDDDDGEDGAQCMRQNPTRKFSTCTEYVCMYVVDMAEWSPAGGNGIQYQTTCVL